MNSSSRQIILPLNKERRCHLHQEIDSLAIPVTLQTTRVGSPFKLVLTKEPRQFKQDEKRRKLAAEVLQGLENWRGERKIEAVTHKERTARSSAGKPYI